MMPQSIAVKFDCRPMSLRFIDVAPMQVGGANTLATS